MALLELLSIETGASFETLSRIIATAPRRYKVYTIPKRNGGTRTIAHPARELKVLQRIFLHQVLNKIPVSEIATAYVKGRGIAFNARQHAHNGWILKLDFKDFFHSIKPGDWDRVVRRTAELKPFAKDRFTLHKVLFWGFAPKRAIPTCLSIGAPTSPAISNLACVKLDQWMTERASRMGIVVTRYADDITVSGSNVETLLKFESSLNTVLSANRGIALELNAKKRGLYGPGERRMVTGLVLTPDGNVSVGRDRKRLISSLIHRFSLGDQEFGETMRAKGLLAFVYSVEPQFYVSMELKYGPETIRRLMTAGPELDLSLDGLEF